MHWASKCWVIFKGCGEIGCGSTCWKCVLCGVISTDCYVSAVHVKCLFVFYLQLQSHGIRGAVQSYISAALKHPNFTAAFVFSCFVQITVADTAIMSEVCARVFHPIRLNKSTPSSSTICTNLLNFFPDGSLWWPRSVDKHSVYYRTELWHVTYVVLILWLT